MDTRRQHGQYWPGTRTGGGETPTPADNGKVDRVDLGTLPADATGAEMRTAIRNIQNAIRPLATAIAAALCGFVMAQTAPWDSLRGGVHVVTNEQDTAAMARIVSATNALGSEMSAMSERVSVKVALATNGIPARIAAATNGMPEKIVAATNALHTSLAPTISAASTALQPAATNDIPAQIAAATNGLPEKIAAATNGIPAKIAAVTNGLPEKIAAATNDVPVQIAAATNDIPARIAASTNGLTEKIASATNALHRGLAPTIAAASTALQPAATNAVAQAMAKQAANLSDRIEQMSLAFAASNTATRLATPDGSKYQDATGVVWQAENVEAPGLFRLDRIEYYTNGVMVAETNELPGVEWTLWEGYDNGAWEMLAGESGKEEDVGECYREWRDFTNHVAAADMEDVTKFYYLAQLVVAGEEYELQYDGGISESQITFEWPMTEPYKTRFLNFSRTNVTASVWTPIDRVMFESTVPQTGGGITTNDVCAIVTNTVDVGFDVGFKEWSITRNGDQYYYELQYVDNEGWNVGDARQEYEEEYWEKCIGSLSSTYLEWTNTLEGVSILYVATRHQITQNALGLARLVDLPPLTNGIPEAISEKASTASLASLSDRLSQASKDGTNYTDTATAGLVSTNYNGNVHIIGAVSQGFNTTASGDYSHAEGVGTTASGYCSHAAGVNTAASGYCSHAEGVGTTASNLSFACGYSVDATNFITFAWQGYQSGSRYGSHGDGTYNIKPVGGLKGFWIGETNLYDYISYATNDLHQSIAPTIFAASEAGTNYTDSAIAATDTSYPRVIGITNINQTVQYVAINSDVPTTLSIMLPTSGDTKDWIVYVTAQTNVTINLPAATWWLADTSATNDIAPRTPTALYFSQAAETIYTVGRQEFKKVEIQ